MRAAATAVLLLAAACGGAPATSPSDAGAVFLAPAGAAATPGHPADGITCDADEGSVLHIHTHLDVFVQGQRRLVPPDIGIVAGTCLSWLHTHDDTGVIHIESPVQRTFTLGDFFDIWGQPLSPTAVGPAQGDVRVLVNGAAWSGDPGAVTLDAHGQIQLDVGTPRAAVQTFDWPPGL
jgi:hypothetical protein